MEHALFFAASSLLYAQRVRFFKWLNPTVDELFIYPIKSCGGIRLQSCRVTKRGLEHDREFMLVDRMNKFISQRTHPKMALIGCRILSAGLLEVTAPGMKPFTINLERPAIVSDRIMTVTVWGDACEAVEVIGSMWFNEYLLGRVADEIKLVRIADGFTRPTDGDYAPHGQAAFSDGYPLLIVSKESLHAVNRRLTSPVTMLHFRPNVVVATGGWAGFAEDTWRRIAFHGGDDAPLYMNVVKPCDRCKVPTIDPATGTFDENNEPTRTMATFRSGKALGFQKDKWQDRIFFCMNASNESNEGTVSVGDRVEIVSYQRF